MSQALQRVVVRLLHDPALVARLYGGQRLPELSEEEHKLLLATDPRAWGTDPYRRSRLLTALIEEHPASAALVGRDRNDGFFSSPEFHRCIQDRGLLALAFADWAEQHVGSVASLERAFALARRPRQAPPGLISVAEGFVPVSVPQGTLARLTAIRQRLGDKPAEAIATGRFQRPELPALGPGQEHLLVERDARGEIGVSEASEALVGLLAFAWPGRSRAAMLATARALGADPGEDAETLDGMLAEGLLVLGVAENPTSS